MRTTIYEKEYVDLIPIKGKLYLFPKGSFVKKRIDIVPWIDKIERIQITDERLDMKSAIIRGLIGTWLAGTLGTILGVASGKRHPEIIYRIVFKAGFEVPEIHVMTSWVPLVDWLNWHTTGIGR